MTGLVAEVALMGATLGFDKLYTYAVPPELHEKARAGCRAVVPFGRANTKKQCMIFRIKQGELAGLKKIVTITDIRPVLNEEMLGLCEYMRNSVFCTYYDAVSAMLPTGLGLKLINYYSANSEFSAVSLLDETEKEVFNYLFKNFTKYYSNNNTQGPTANNVAKVMHVEIYTRNSHNNWKNA